MLISNSPNIQTNKKSSNTPSFEARFIFNGNKNEANDFINFIRNELKNSHQPTDVLVHRKGGTSLVLTAHDAVSANKDDLPGINVSEFYDNKTKTFVKGIMSFDPNFGWYKKLFSQKKNGITRYFTKTENPKEKAKVFPRMDFAKPQNLTEGLLSIAPIAEKWRHDMTAYKGIEEYGLSTTKVKGLAGMGEYSIYFNVDDETVLKVSTNPCYPKIQEPFDLPAIQNGFIPLKNKTIYFSFLPKAENYSEKKISEDDVNSVIKAIEEKGYKTWDILPSDTRQVVSYQGKVYLCDVDCAKLQSGESRLFERQYLKQNQTTSNLIQSS